ncbi:hypothetical protein ZIOFF_032156 [Zingiber officinale]|uniref:Uncharacterized protein n=1 Tax=Zingiber officinale TaxID=94328 RepID=A0A8J5LBE3_ZINOF|nr:hypothetical protein ZIOFF_032156 [Zingiber officinale]
MVVAHIHVEINWTNMYASSAAGCMRAAPCAGIAFISMRLLSHEEAKLPHYDSSALHQSRGCLRFGHGEFPTNLVRRYTNGIGSFGFPEVFWMNEEEDSDPMDLRSSAGYRMEGRVASLAWKVLIDPHGAA